MNKFPLVFLALLAAPAFAADAVPDAETQLWANAKNGDAKQGSWQLLASYDTNCAKLGGRFDLGVPVLASASRFKARNDMYKKLRDDESKADFLHDGMKGPHAALLAACAKLKGHEQDKSSNSNFSNMGSAFTNQSEAYKKQLVQVWSDTQSLDTLIVDEVKARSEIANGKPGTDKIQSDAIKLLTFCRNQLPAIRKAAADGGKYALDLADQVKSTCP